MAVEFPATPAKAPGLASRVRQLPRNVWAVSLTSFLMDISSEMVINILPLFLSNVLGVKTNIIGVIEGLAEAVASILKVFSGWLSDRVGGRKWLAVVGYGFSALTKPLFYFAPDVGGSGRCTLGRSRGQGHPHGSPATRSLPTLSTSATAGWLSVFTVRPIQRGPWSACSSRWGSSGLRSAARWRWARTSSGPSSWSASRPPCWQWRRSPSWPAMSRLSGARAAPKFAFRALGRPFVVFMLIVGLFDLGNSSDAFLVPARPGARAQRGRHPWHAHHLQPHLHPDFNPCGRAIGPHWPPQDHHRRLGRLRHHLPWFRLCADRVADLGPLRPVWVLLWPGLRHGQGVGGRPRARRTAR